MDSEVSAPECPSDVLTSTENGSFEYETQHFGFQPITLLNGMFNAVCDLYREAFKAFCKTCSEKYPDVITEEQMRKACHEVCGLIDKDICSTFDTLEYFLLHKVFSIHENAVLPEDKCQLQRLSEDEQHELEKKKDDLKKRIIAIKYANAVLDQHLKDAETIQSSVNKILEQLSSSESSVPQLEGKVLKDWFSYYSEILRKGLGPVK